MLGHRRQSSLFSIEQTIASMLASMLVDATPLDEEPLGVDWAS